MKDKGIAIFGGTFNPIHYGHLNLALTARNKLKLDKVIFVPAYIPPHKKITDKIFPNYRLNMVKLAIKGKKGFIYSDYEIKKKNKSYSISTIKYFKRKFEKRAEIYFLIGSDSLSDIYKWKDINKAMELAQFVVFARPGRPIKNRPNGIYKIALKEKDISSTDIRDAVRKNKSIKNLTPAAVAEYIKKKKLYLK